MNCILKRAFTLIEVNLAIFIMAGGVLAMISLYSLGFRESRQSREDVTSAAFADLVLNPLVTALSSTNITWTAWKSISFENVDSADGKGQVQVLPKKGAGEGAGWFAYIKLDGSEADRTYYVHKDPASTADGVYGDLVGQGDKSLLPESVQRKPSLPRGMTYALVASRETKDSPIITLAVRCVRKNLRNMLMAQPVFSTEVRFQGDPNR